MAMGESREKGEGEGEGGSPSRRTLLRVAPRGANFIEIDYRSRLLLQSSLPARSHVAHPGDDRSASLSPGVLIQLEPAVI